MPGSFIRSSSGSSSAGASAERTPDAKKAAKVFYPTQNGGFSNEFPGRRGSPPPTHHSSVCVEREITPAEYLQLPDKFTPMAVVFGEGARPPYVADLSSDSPAAVPYQFSFTNMPKRRPNWSSSPSASSEQGRTDRRTSPGSTRRTPSPKPSFMPPAQSTHRYEGAGRRTNLNLATDRGSTGSASSRTSLAEAGPATGLRRPAKVHPAVGALGKRARSPPVATTPSTSSTSRASSPVSDGGSRQPAKRPHTLPAFGSLTLRPKATK